MFWGWWFAVGICAPDFRARMRPHLLAAKALGLKVGAPMFIPFMGAFIALKEAPPNAWVEARVGIGGPMLGAFGAGVCYVIYLVTDNPMYGGLAACRFPAQPLQSGARRLSRWRPHRHRAFAVALDRRFHHHGAADHHPNCARSHELHHDLHFHFFRPALISFSARKRKPKNVILKSPALDDGCHVFWFHRAPHHRHASDLYLARSLNR